VHGVEAEPATAGIHRVCALVERSAVRIAGRHEDDGGYGYSTSTRDESGRHVILLSGG
jgi:hypothetical protein